MSCVRYEARRTGVVAETSAARWLWQGAPGARDQGGFVHKRTMAVFANSRHSFDTPFIYCGRFLGFPMGDTRALVHCLPSAFSHQEIRSRRFGWVMTCGQDLKTSCRNIISRASLPAAGPFAADFLAFGYQQHVFTSLVAGLLALQYSDRLFRLLACWVLLFDFFWNLFQTIRGKHLTFSLLVSLIDSISLICSC